MVDNPLDGHSVLDDDSVRSRLDAVERKPLASRAEEYAQIYAELSSQLEG